MCPADPLKKLDPVGPRHLVLREHAVVSVRVDCRQRCFGAWLGPDSDIVALPGEVRRDQLPERLVVIDMEQIDTARLKRARSSPVSATRVIILFASIKRALSPTAPACRVTRRTNH